MIGGFLFIEPKKQPTQCIVDSLTRKITAVMRQAVRGRNWMGYHTCVCGAQSSSSDWSIVLTDRRLTTNSLAIHYIACHRDEVPKEQIEALEALEIESHPTPYELMMPGSRMPDDDFRSLPLYCFKKNINVLTADSPEWRLNLGLYYLTQGLMERVLAMENIFVELITSKRT